MRRPILLEYDVDSLRDYATGKLADLDRHSLRRGLRSGARGDSMHIVRDGRTLLSFSDNDYLGLSRDIRVIEAAQAALEEFGAGAGSSRHITGEVPLYDKLEAAIADLKGTEAALVFGSGYMANIGIIPALVGDGDLILIDELAHACLYSGAQLSGARIERFRHNDVDQVRDVLGATRGCCRNAMILTEGVFSMDGDLAPLPELSGLAGEFNAWLHVDDAHGLGVVGDGRGATHAFDTAFDVPLKMGTLSKAVGAYGGYLAADADVIALMTNRARSVIYTTALPPATLAAALAGLRIIGDDPGLCRQPNRRARLFADALGLPEPPAAIVPVVIGSPERALQMSGALAEKGFLVTAIRPPTVPAGTSRLRIAFSAVHSDEDVLALARAIDEIGAVQ